MVKSITKGSQLLQDTLNTKVRGNKNQHKFQSVLGSSLCRFGLLVIFPSCLGTQCRL